MSTMTTCARMRVCLADLLAAYLTARDHADAVRDLLNMNAAQIAEEFASWRMDARDDATIARTMSSHGF